MIHDRLVCNDTLAQLSDRYGITEQIKTSVDAQHIKQQIVKLRGSAFEAWVAGVYYDRLAGRSNRGVSAPGLVVAALTIRWKPCADHRA